MMIKRQFQLFKNIFVSILLFAVVGIHAENRLAKAPDFSGTTRDGSSIQLADFQGNVILVDFWASWCGPCRKEMPFLVDLYAQKKESGFSVIAINLDKEKKNMEKFLSVLSKKPEFPILLDPESKLCPLYQLEGMPTSILIDRKGMIRFRHVGFKEGTGEQMIQEIDLLLGEKELKAEK